jgi:hypothetical protein
LFAGNLLALDGRGEQRFNEAELARNAEITEVAFVERRGDELSADGFEFIAEEVRLAGGREEKSATTLALQAELRRGRLARISSSVLQAVGTKRTQ